jgi:acetoin utilization deacetylase AcuC-like enzyme
MADNGSRSEGSDVVGSWHAERRRARRRSLWRTGSGLAIGTGLLLMIGLSGAPETGVDPGAIPSPNPDGRLVWHPSYGMPWFDSGHRLLLRLVVGNHAVPIDRFPALTRRLTATGLVTEADLVLAAPATHAQLALVHTDAYLENLDRLTGGWPIQRGLLRPGENRINSDLYAFIRASVGGTVEAARIALDHGRAMNLSGGYHHAFPDHEEGFCFVNDVAVAIEVLRAEGRIERAMIVDLDTHHGNGNAAVFRGRDDVTIFDVYERDNYPQTKLPIEYPIPLGRGVGDEEYLGELARLSDAVAEVQPDLLFYIAGADPFANDVLGNQRLTMEGLRQRDEIVLGICRALEVPCAVVLGGGYSTAGELGEINARTALAVLGRLD